MAKKTNAQLMKEIAALRKKNSKKDTKLKKQAKTDRKNKELKAELKSLKKSPLIKKLKKISESKIKEVYRKRPTKEQLKKSRKKIVSGAKKTHSLISKIVERVGNIQ